MNPTQRGNAKTRRKQARLANRKKSLATTTTTTNETAEQEDEGEEEEEEEVNSTEAGFERDGDEEEENGSFVHDHDTNVHTKRALSSSGETTKVAPKLHPTSSLSAMQEEQNFPSKPQASVAPVKQSSYYAPYSRYESNSRYNGYSSSSYNYSNQNSLPPRFQQQREQREAAAQRRYRGRRGQYRSPTFYNSSRYPADYDQSERELDEPTNDQYSSQQDSGMPNDDSSESENLSGKISRCSGDIPKRLLRCSFHFRQDVVESESLDIR